MTNAYIKGGYITSRAFVNPNPPEEGVLEILVIEGTVEKIIINDGKAKGQEFTAFPGLTGGPLNLRDIDQGLDQLNRLPSNNTVMQIEPGGQLQSRYRYAPPGVAAFG